MGKIFSVIAGFPKFHFIPSWKQRQGFSKNHLHVHLWERKALQKMVYISSNYRADSSTTAYISMTLDTWLAKLATWQHERSDQTMQTHQVCHINASSNSQFAWNSIRGPQQTNIKPGIATPSKIQKQHAPPAFPHSTYTLHAKAKILYKFPSPQPIPLTKRNSKHYYCQ